MTSSRRIVQAARGACAESVARVESWWPRRTLLVSRPDASLA